VAQAENFLAVAPRDEGALPLAVDIEFAGNCVAWESLATIQRELRVFVAHLESNEGRPPLLYTPLGSLGELIPPELQGYSYWIRSLWGEPGVPVRWLFWQHSSTGEVPGVRGPVDLNVFSDSASAWRELVASPAQDSR
jgi:lysozyme